MNSDENKIKEDIISKYDRSALEKNNETWLKKGSSIRVPESYSAHYFIDRKIDEAIRLCAKSSKELRVVEIGCCFGEMTSLLAEKFSDVTAIDISPKAIALARRRFEYYGARNVKFAVDDMENLTTLNDNSCDIVFSFSTIRYCPHPGQALKKIYDKLDANGVIVIDFPNRYSPWHFVFKPVLSMKKHIHDNLYSSKEAVRMLKKTGFKKVEYKIFLFTPRQLPDFLLPFFRIIDRLFEKIPLIRSYGGIIMIRGVKDEKSPSDLAPISL